MNIKKSMISVAAAALLVTGFAGCDTGDTSTTSAINVNSNEHTPTGTVTGYVQDTNGQPLSGVKVYIANKETTTNAGGLYTFTNVPVSNTVGSDANTTSNIISVTIAAPTGYLGASVTVMPSSQIDSAENVSTGSTTSGVETFIDGYLAQAGTAVLPALTATVTGRLELFTSEASVGTQEITLDFQNVTTTAGANVAQAQNGVTTTYSTNGLTFSATTAADGTFTISGVPSDSNLTYVVPSYRVNGEDAIQADGTAGDTTVVTNSETSLVNVGDVQVTAIVNEDNSAPLVSKVNGIITQTATTGQLDDDTYGATVPFVITFTEAIDATAVDANSVLVYFDNAKLNTVSAEMTSSNVLTVTTDADVAAGKNLDIYLLKSDFKDAAGNAIIADAAASGVGFDKNSSDTNGNYVHLDMTTYTEVNTNAKVGASSQMKKDSDGTLDVEDVQTALPAFNDVNNNGTGVISQLNNADNDTNATLDALLTALNPTGTNVVTDTARFKFTPNGASKYIVSAKTVNGVARADMNTVITLANTDAATIATTSPATNEYNITVTDTTSITDLEILMTSADIGDVVTITPVDGLDFSGTATTVTLADNVEPTTVLQNAYGQGNTHSGSNTVVSYGDGAELANTSGTNIVGTPYFHVTPGLLDNLSSTGATLNPESGVISDNVLTHELFDLSTKDANGDYYSSTTTAPSTTSYDATAYAAFGAQARTVGVAFSEDIDLTDVTLVPGTGSATLSNFAAHNDENQQDDNGTITSGTIDLVNMDVDDVITLANTDGQANRIIDFAGIKDTSGNVATVAKVIVQDAMPPLLTKATWNGTDIVLTFNENLLPIASYDAAALATNNPQVSINGADYNITTDSNATVVDNVLTIKGGSSSGARGITTVPVFAGADYVESVYGTTSYVHADINYSGVRDLKGNSWTNANAGVSQPLFAGVDIVPNLGYALLGNPGYVYNSTSTDVNLTVTFNQPIAGLYAIDVNSSNDINTTKGTLIVNGASDLIDSLVYVETNGSKWPARDGNITATGSTITINGATVTFTNINLANAALSGTGDFVMWVNSDDANKSVSYVNTNNNNKYNYKSTSNPQ